MSGTGREATARETVGNFQDERSLEAAIDKLQRAGFDRYDISVVAGRRSFELKFGAMYSNVAELEDDPETPTPGRHWRRLGAYEVISWGGTSTAAYLAAGLGGCAGGIIGGWVSKLIDRHHAEYVGQQLARGGLLLWVRTTDLAREAKVRHIMTCQAARSVHIRDGVTGIYTSE